MEINTSNAQTIKKITEKDKKDALVDAVME